MLQCVKHLRCRQSMFIRGNDSQISLLHPRSSHFHQSWHLGTQDGPSKCLVLSLSVSCLSLKIHPLFIPSASHPLWFTQRYGKIKGFWSKAQFNMLVAEVRAKWLLAASLRLCCAFFWSQHLQLEVLRRGGLRFIPHGLVVLSLDLSSSSCVTLSLAL